MDNACAGAVITDRNTDPRIFIDEGFHENRDIDYSKALFAIVKGSSHNNWEVHSINIDHNTGFPPLFPKEWAGLVGNKLCDKITEHLIVSRYGQLGFLNGKLPSDFRELPNHRFGLLDADYEKMRIRDALQYNESLQSVIVISKETAIKVATTAADYLMVHKDKASGREELNSNSVVQPWLSNISMMKQAVVLTCIRGNDGSMKYDKSKPLVRWLRRCILVSAFDKCIITNPYDPRGGSFTGPSCKCDNDKWESAMDEVVSEYLTSTDYLHHHFQMHIIHGAEVLGYEHPDTRIRNWWLGVYKRLVNELHLNIETKDHFDYRLGDEKDQWLSVSDKATI